jgi:hypothetical protein
MTDPQKIFEGVRTKITEVMKENNFVVAMTEYNSILYLGCKDGTIFVSDQREKNGRTKRFVPYGGKDVLVLATCDGFLVSQSVS